MRFNIAFLGYPPLFHLRRDFILALKYGLEDLGHDVSISGFQIDTARFNLLISAYFIPKAEMASIDQSGVEFAHVNTEVIANDMVNFNPRKTDFLGAYLPSMRKGRFIWDVIHDNLSEHRRYGNNAHFLRWGWHPRLEDVEQRETREYDFYFFGLMSDRRTGIIKDLHRRGFSGLFDSDCPYFLRNDRIARSRVQLNVVQDDKYTHVNSFRLCYLANNRCAILSEAESDPAGYLSLAQVVHRGESLADALSDLLRDNRWRARGEEAYATFRELPMTRCLEELLDKSFGGAGHVAGAAA
jgi:hypothetical protein